MILNINKMPRVQILVNILAFLFTFLLCSCTKQPTPSSQNNPPNQVTQNLAQKSLVPIKVAQYGEFVIYLPLYIAKEKGFFERQGLDVSITSTGGDDKTFAAVISGNAQFGIADPTFVAIAKSKGQSGAVVATVVNGIPEWGIAKGDSKIPDIKKPKTTEGIFSRHSPIPIDILYPTKTDVRKRRSDAKH